MKKGKSGGNYWLFGHHAVVAALQNEIREKLELRLVKDTPLDPNLIKGMTARTVSKPEIEAVLPQGAVHQGMALLVKPLAHGFLDEVIRHTSNKDRSVVLLLDQVTDPHNIGAILRSAAAFDADAVMIPDTNAPIETGTLAKSACGALEIVPFVRVTNLARAMQELKTAGFWMLGLDGNAPKSIGTDKLPKKTAFVLGAEGDGLRRLTAENCDEMIKLPISSKMESLNVSNAAAIALYAFRTEKG